MADETSGFRLGDLLVADEVGARPVRRDPAALDRVIRRARLLTSGPLASGVEPDTLLVHVALGISDPDAYLRELERIAAIPGSHVIAVWPPPEVDDRLLAGAAGRHVLLRVDAQVDPASLVSVVARAVRPAEQTMTQRLTSLQRSMTQSLAEPEPLRSLAARLARTCNAVAAIVRADGELETASGPLPLALLLDEFADEPGDTRPFTVEGWYGVGVRITGEDGPAGWLLMASRRASFPDAYAIAAAHVAASLVETNLRIDLLARRQDLAVRSSLLEQLLALRLERHDPELEGRLAALGLTFADEVRAIDVTLLPGHHRSHRTAALDALFRRLDQDLTAIGAPHLLAVRDTAVIGLAQASAATARRIFQRINSPTRSFLLGIGRRATSVGAVVDSYNDALLAVRTLRAPGRTATVMSYEEFDFATRLFSDIGLERMAEWADDMLRPLADQQILIDGLRLYFEHGMNIIAAAKALKIHHNSLRYRLARAEELLGVSLRDPAAVSSLFLALTATAMVRQPATRRPDTPSHAERPPGTALPTDARSNVLSAERGSLAAGFGVAIGPER